ncbi:unnamed protein product [Merluccius merluccius]
MRKNILLFLSLSGHLLGYHASPPASKTYYYVDQKLGWAHAQQHCREHFEDLATVDNVEELQRLQESRNGFEYDNNFMWIGLYDDRTSWQWSLGNQNYKYGQDYGIWLSGNPDFWDCKENCTITSKRRSNFKLKISSDVNMTDPEVARQIMDQLYVTLAQEGVKNISWVLKDGQVFHKDQPRET